MRETKVVRPYTCPGCGKEVGLSGVLVRVNRGPWTCEDCDGFIPDARSENPDNFPAELSDTEE